MLTESDIEGGRSYPYELAPGIVTTVTIIGERRVGKMRFVRYTIPGAKLPGYSRASVFAKAVRAAMRL